ncbi:putative lipid-transfer protein DIR1 [Abeliophyllum distichum]|uniref:Lipid-transfer protein DIR1 n=1 Tax=Abeliophyllum distichum TaxID=126358 RepID=A0ABD1P8G4_9LAMI
MELFTKLAIFAMVLAVAIWSQHSMAEDSICGISPDDLMTCKPAVVGSIGQLPSSVCCKALSKADLPCLCSFKSSPWTTFLGINPDLAAKLPVSCKIDPSFHC